MERIKEESVVKCTKGAERPRKTKTEEGCLDLTVRKSSVMLARAVSVKCRACLYEIKSRVE